jgi:hypothetical protein
LINAKVEVEAKDDRVTLATREIAHEGPNLLDVWIEVPRIRSDPMLPFKTLATLKGENAVYNGFA